MVRLADIVKIDAKPYTSESATLRNQVERKHIDFVILDLNTNKIICGIEIDDSSHWKEERKISDEFKNNVFSSIDTKLFRFNTSDLRNNPSIYIEMVISYLNKFSRTNI